MTTVKDIHTGVFGLFQRLIPKTVTVKFTLETSQLNGKRFKFSECTTSSVSEERKTKDNGIYSNEAIEVTLYYDVIEATRDTTDTYDAPKRGYKSNKAQVTYNGIIYFVHEEVNAEFENAVLLICDRNE